MTLQELKDKEREIREEADIKCQNLRIEYAKEHNHVKIGDILIDHSQKILVKDFGVTLYGYSTGEPEMIYIGPLLKMDNTPLKNANQGKIYQSNITKHIIK